MTQISREERVYGEIRACFANFRKLARVSLQRQWGYIGRAERYDAMRSFVRFADLVGNPGKFFSRAANYAGEKKLSPQSDIDSANPFVRPIKKFLYELQK